MRPVMYSPYFELPADGPAWLHPQLAACLRRAGVTAADLSPAGDAALRRTAAAILNVACEEPTSSELDIDLLLDVVAGIDEARVLRGLGAAPLAALRRYDLEHTHLLRPPTESFTPYAELAAVVSLVPRGGSFADLGCGSGRALLVAALRRPDVSCDGYEVVGARAALGREMLARLVGGRRRRRYRCVSRTLGRSRLPPAAADVFFMFNPLAPSSLEALLQQLGGLAQRRPFLLVCKAMDAELRSAPAFRASRPWLRRLPTRGAGLPRGFSLFRAGARARAG